MTEPTSCSSPSGNTYRSMNEYRLNRDRVLPLGAAGRLIAWFSNRPSGSRSA